MADFPDHLILTADYEVFGDGSGDVSACVVEPTEAMLSVAARHGAPVTLFVESLEFDAMRRAAPVRRGLAERLEPPVVDLASADWMEPDRFEIRPGAKRFELWESYVAGKSGLRAAIDYAQSWDIEISYARIQMLAEQVRAGLRELPGAAVHDLGVEKCGIVSFTLDGHDPNDVAESLRAQSINISVSVAGQTRLDMDARGFDALLRASVHYYNTEQEIVRLLEALEGLR